MSNFELSPGVIVDTDRREAYVMSPEGDIVALDLNEGTEVWRSQEAAKPLTLFGDLLISQAEQAGPGNELRIVTMQTRENGKPISQSLVQLPPGVQPMIGQALNRSFMARAQPLDDDAAITWEFVDRALRGMPAGPIEVLPGEEMPSADAALAAEAPETVQPTNEMTVVRGAVRLAPADGTVTPMVAPHAEVAPMAVPPVAAAPGSELAPDAHLPDVPEPQFLSADGRHILSSRRVADDSEWDKYLWTIFDRGSGDRLGEFRTHVRYVAFFVADTRVIYQIQPHARQIGDEMVEEPLQIRATDLQTGERLWHQPVRDITDPTPPPP